MNLNAVRMKFIWTSYQRTNEVNTHVIQTCWHEAHKQFAWKTWNSYESRMIWTSSELHKNCMTSTPEVPTYYTWMWSLTSLLCTSYEWATRSIVEFSGEFPTQRPVTRSFDVFFGLRLNKRLSKQSRGWWFETLSHSLWRHYYGWMSLPGPLLSW